MRTKSPPVSPCQSCGAVSPKWLGRCPECGEWNSYVEEVRGDRQGPAGVAAGGAPPPPRRAGRAAAPLAHVGTAAADSRISTTLPGLDRVLGGGLVPGSLVLLGGEPGIGKSTLTNMVLGHMQQAGYRTLYVSGEESAEQVRLRAERLAPGALQVPVLAETDLEVVL